MSRTSFISKPIHRKIIEIQSNPGIPRKTQKKTRTLMLTQLNLCQLSKYGESQNKSSQLEWITTNDFNLTVWNAVKPSKTIRESLLKSGFDVLIRAESWWLTSNPVKLGTVKSKNRGCYVPPPPARTKIDRPRPFNTPVAGLAWGVGRTCHPEKKERKKRRGSIFCVLLWSCIFILVSFPFAIFIPFHCAPPLPPRPCEAIPLSLAHTLGRSMD